MTPILLTAREAAARLGVARSWVTRHAVDLQAVRVGGLLRVPEDGLAAYLERQRVQAPEAMPQEAPRVPIRALPTRSTVGLVTGRKREVGR